MIKFKDIVPFRADQFVPTPNYSKRKSDSLGKIILHDTADSGNEKGSIQWMASPKSEASAHLFVGRSGNVVRMVEDKFKAWHAGESSWKGVKGLNDTSIGIEMANRNNGEVHTEAQYMTVAMILAHYVIQGLDLRADVLGHYHISPGRKTDPGGYVASTKRAPGWDWNKINNYTTYALYVIFGQGKADSKNLDLFKSIPYETREEARKVWRDYHSKQDLNSHGQRK